MNSKHSLSKMDQGLVLRKALINTAMLLNLKQIELSEIIGSSASEISRLYHGTSKILPNSKEGECALLLIRIYRSLDALLGDDEKQIQAWFRSYNRHLNDTPLHLSKSIVGLVGIVSYLDAMRGLL